MNKTPQETAKSMAETNADLQVTLDIYRKLNNEIVTQSETMIPIMREYLKVLTEVRMAFGREVLDILRSGRELQSITKGVDEVSEFVANVDKLYKLLSDEKFVAKLERLNDSKD